MKFFTSDTHFEHEDVIKGSNRPFANIAEHDKALIANWNSVVTPDDDIYHLGDFAYNPFYRNSSKETEDKAYETFAAILEQLNGRIHWVYGNHDPIKKKNLMNALKQYFVWTGTQLEISIRDEDLEKKNQKILLHHCPWEEWYHKDNGGWQLHGHMHNKLPDRPDLLRLDVGVDCQNYTPVSYAQLKEQMSHKIFVPTKSRKEKAVA